MDDPQAWPACHSWPATLPDNVPDVGAFKVGRVRIQPLVGLAVWHAGRCAICGSHPVDEPTYTGLSWLHMDHNHDTGLIRGWLCCSCNSIEGQRYPNEPARFQLYRDRPPSAILGVRVPWRGRMSTRLRDLMEPIGV